MSDKRLIEKAVKDLENVLNGLHLSDEDIENMRNIFIDSGAGTKAPITDLVMCPNNQCNGVLQLMNGFHTDMGYEKVDENRKSENFECPICGVMISRAYEWRVDGWKGKEE